MTLLDVPTAPAEASAANARRIKQFRCPRHLGTWLAGSWLALVVGTATIADLLPLAEGRDPGKTLATTGYIEPSILSGHPLGTDGQGLDILAQLVYGSRVSIIVAGGAVLIAATIGTLVGAVVGFRGRRIDAIVGLMTDVVMSFPPLILLLALVTILEPDLLTITLALAVLATPGFLRLGRANAIRVAHLDFIVAGRTLGATERRLLVRDVLPTVVPSVAALCLISVAYLIVAEASLSFLGLGIRRPTPTWGNIISQGQERLDTFPVLVFAPAFALFLTVLAANFLGQRLQQRWSL